MKVESGVTLLRNRVKIDGAVAVHKIENKSRHKDSMNLRSDQTIDKLSEADLKAILSDDHPNPEEKKDGFRSKMKGFNFSKKRKLNEITVAESEHEHILSLIT